MMSPWVVFTLIICKVFHSGAPFKRIHFLGIFFTSPKILHFHCSRSLSFDGVVCNANGRCIIAMHRYSWLGMSQIFKGGSKNIPSWQLRNNAPNSASAADATTNRTIAHNVWNAPFSLMGLPSIGNVPMKKCPHALLRAFSSLRYDASEWMFNTISDARNLTTASGCDAK